VTESCAELPISRLLIGVITKLSSAIIMPSVLPSIPSRLAVMVTLPADIDVTKPDSETEAMLSSEDIHIALFDMSSELSSDEVPVAINCWLSPIFKFLEKLLTDIELRVGLGSGVESVEELLPLPPLLQAIKNKELSMQSKVCLTLLMY